MLDTQPDQGGPQPPHAYYSSQHQYTPFTHIAKGVIRIFEAISQKIAIRLKIRAKLGVSFYAQTQILYFPLGESAFL